MPIYQTNDYTLLQIKEKDGALNVTSAQVA